MLDCIVIGAGPAGSTTAGFAAEKGASTLIIDRKKDVGKPIQCGEFIPRTPEMFKLLPGVKNLEELFNIDDSLVSRKTQAIIMKLPSGKEYRLDFQGQSLNRDKFDQHLLGLARENGAEFKVERALDLEQKKGHWEVTTNKGIHKAKVVVGADGPGSKVGKWAGLEGPAELSPCILAWAKGDFGSDVQFHFGNVAPGGYAWVIPKDGQANIGLGVQKRFAQDNLKYLLEKLLEDLGVKASKFSSGMAPVSGPVPQSMTNGLLLVGDAAGHVLASNGGGIPLSLICGRIAGQVIGDHIQKGRMLHDYETAWRKQVGGLLTSSLKTKRMADRVFGSDTTLEWSLRFLGKRGLARMIRGQSLFL